jgi:hypothetical protein
MYRPKPARPREVLNKYDKAIVTAIRECGLCEPTPKDVQRALEDYRMFTAREIVQLVAKY